MPTIPTKPCTPQPNFGIPTSAGKSNISYYINSEYQNLQTHQQYVDQIREEKYHIDEMEDSYRKRVMEYLKMIIVLCIVLAFLWIIRVLHENELLPTGALEFLTIAIISTGCIVEYMLYFGIPSVYMGIVSRNLIHFDEINYDPPQLNKQSSTSIRNVTISPSISPSLSGATATCFPQVIT